MNVSASGPALDRAPLRYRIPNPPPIFVGREKQVAALEARVRRAPVSVVRGLGGIGKTALILQTLHRAFPERVDRAIFIGLRPAQPPDLLEVEVLRALADAHAGARIEWSGLLHRRDALLAALVDHAEARDAWIVIDDLHHTELRATRDSLVALSRYARKTRWIVATRVGLEIPELVDQTVALDGMATRELYALAERCAPQETPLVWRRAATSSAGSPWSLRQILAGADPRRSADEILRGLADDAIALLETLAVLDLPLSPSSLGAVTPLPAAPALEALERRGLVEVSSAGLRLHDVARPILSARDGLAKRKTQAARALGELDDPLATLEAARLQLDLGRLDEAATLLEAACDRIFAAELAPRLAQLLAANESPRFARLRLRCAVELGDTSALEAAKLPEAPTLGDRLLWAASHFMRGRPEESARAAREVRRAAASEPHSGALAVEAGILEAACYGEGGRPEAALEVLDALPRITAGVDRLAIHQVRWLVQLGRVDEALEGLGTLVARLRASDVSERSELRDEVIVASCFLGRIRVLEQVQTSDSAKATAPAALFESRRHLLCEGIGAVYAGRLEEAQALLEAARPLAGQASYLRSFLYALEVELRLARGDLGGLEARLRTAQSEATRSRHVLNLCLLSFDARRLAILRARANAPPEAEAAPPFWAALNAAVERQHALLHGLAPPPVPRLADRIIHGRVLNLCSDAVEHLLGSEPEAAHHAAVAAHAAALEHRHLPGRLEALRIACDTLFVAGDHEALARTTRELSALAERAGSPRFLGEARWFAAVHAGSARPHALQASCALSDVAPIAARRARALLGEDVPLDRLDSVVLRAVTSGSAVPVIRRVSDARGAIGARPGWGLETGTRRVWLPGERWVELATRPLLYRILSAIAEHGGRATKEQIVTSAWERDEYHPLRDDKRLQVAIRKLRVLIEEHPSRPRRLITVTGGYAFGKEEAFWISASADELAADG